MSSLPMSILACHTQGAVVGLGTRVRPVGCIGYLPRRCLGLTCKEITCVSFLACRRLGRVTRFITDIDKLSITSPFRVIRICPRLSQLCRSTAKISPKQQFLSWTITSSTSSKCGLLRIAGCLLSEEFRNVRQGDVPNWGKSLKLFQTFRCELAC